MNKKADIIFQQKKFLVTGDLNFCNVMSIYEKSLPAMTTSPELEFDFSHLTSSDSSGLALIMEWIKFAKENHKKIRFNHLPTELVSIAKAANMDRLITHFD